MNTDMDKLKDYIIKYFMNNKNINPVSDISIGSVSLNDSDSETDEIYSRINNSIDEDELFYVLKGRLEMHFRDKIEILLPGQIIVVPRGVDHKPLAKEETWIMLFEPQSTDHTGGVQSPLRQNEIKRI